MDDVRRRLLDLTRANRLLNHKASGARTLEVIDELPREVFRLLVEEEKALQFLAREEAPPAVAAALARREAGAAAGEGEHTWRLAPLEAEAGAARYSDRKLQTALPGEKLQTRLLAIARDAKAAIDEQGANTLYLTLGMVEWRAADASDVINRAPLLFVPVQLERKNANSRHFITLYDEEILTNPCLVELARQDFGFALGTFDEEGDETLEAFFGRVQRDIAGVQGWRLAEEIHLGLFSFAKLLMWRDLNDRHWPEVGKLSAHALIKTLRGEAAESGESDPGGGVPDEKMMDGLVKPVDAFHVMDADSSQAAAILAVKGGTNLVIEGPPGTGKSQTITNMIAECLAAGKTVLFVAEKAAALEVVKRRLTAAGLGDAALALHSKNTKKGDVMGELRRVLEAQESVPAAALGGAEELLGVRDRLRAYHEEIHRAGGALGISIFQAVGEAVRWGSAPEIACALPDVLAWSGEKLALAREQLETFERRLERVGDVKAHPWRACGIETLTLQTRQTLMAQAESAGARVTELRAAAASLAEALRVGTPASVAEAEDLLGLAERMKAAPVIAAEAWSRFDGAKKTALAAWAELSERYAAEKAVWTAALRDDAESEDWSAWLARREKGGGLLAFFSGSWRADTRRFRQYWRLKAKPVEGEEIRLVKAVMVSGNTRGDIVRGGETFAELLGGAWKGWGSDADAVAEAASAVVGVGEILERSAVPRDVVAAFVSGDRTGVLETAAALKARVAEFRETWKSFLATSASTDEGWRAAGGRTLHLGDLAARLESALSAGERLEEWTDLNAAKAAARLGPAGHFAEWRMSAKGAAGGLAGGFLRQFYRCWVDAALQREAVVREWRGEDYAALAGRFKALDRAWIETTRRRIAAALAERRPDVSGRTARQSELGVLKAELRKKKRFMPLRKLFVAAGETVQSIKPCFMMSPISVAQYLTPGALAFDLVIFDEASQVEPADAFGAIARGRQVVLVGDEKQLPPTNFFSRMEGEEGTEEESSVGDVESILGLGAARLGQRCGLRWHYRSRHASLIEFSNEKFYDGALRVFASPHTDRSEMGLGFRFVEGGVYQRGSGRYNLVEAKAVAQAVLEHARRSPGMSLGVGALNLPQANAILDELETLRRENKSDELEAFFDDTRAEPFFVKNLENIQGDEREVMLLSVGYGYDAAGKMSASFGAINGEGGWRRLNVFATRARQRCLIFSSIRSEDIRLGESAPRGVAALKEYLYAAEHGRMAESPRPMKDHDSPFEAEVCRALREKGWEVHAQVGTAEFFIDLAVVDSRRPGRYLLGIECDGEVYHRTATARDRDRLRQEVLEGLGWKILRVWSTDWFRRREETLRGLVGRIEAAGREG